MIQPINKKKPLRVGLFFTDTNRDYNKSAASTWIRLWQMIDIYELQGVDVSFNNFFKRYDVAILYRKPKKKYYRILQYLNLISKKIYFDTCINIFEENEEIDVDRLKYAHKIAGLADGIVCASNQIAKYAEPHANSVYTMEDPVNTSYFSPVKESINFENPMFGWAGVGIKSVFLNRYSDIIDNRIHIISEPQIETVSLDFKYTYANWKYETFNSELQKIDIALLPRDITSNYNKGHSSFKALVFASLGIPIIANRVPSYVDMAKYYDGIVFLEDYNDDINSCIDVLKTRTLNTDKVRAYYSRENMAINLFVYLHSN